MASRDCSRALDSVISRVNRLRVSPGLRVAIVLSATLFAACGAAPAPPTRDVVVWRTLGAWSGRALLQTNPFESDTGMLRVTWEARNDTPSMEGRLRVILHSAVSGRYLAVVVDHRGVGRDTQYVNEDPRGFFLVIESAGADWAVEVAEGIPARQVIAH